MKYNDRLRKLEAGESTFRPMNQYLAQVLTAQDMEALDEAGWKWGFATFTLQSGDLESWLAAVWHQGTDCRVSVNANWFDANPFDLSEMGRRGVENLRRSQSVVSGIEIEGVSNDDAYPVLEEALGDMAYLLHGYQHNGRLMDAYSRLWYPLAYQDTPEIGELKVRPHDCSQSYPPTVVQAREPQRTDTNRPVKGVSTAHMWLQVSGSIAGPSFVYHKGDRDTQHGVWKTAPGFGFNGLDWGVWTEQDGTSGANNQTLTGFIRPGRGHMHYQLLVCHLLNVNQVTWYTNGNSKHPGKNMHEWAPDLFGDLVHVIESYDAKKMINTHEDSYKFRNYFVAAAPGNG